MLILPIWYVQQYVHVSVTSWKNFSYNLCLQVYNTTICAVVVTDHSQRKQTTMRMTLVSVKVGKR